MTYQSPRYPRFKPQGNLSDMWKKAMHDIRGYNAIDDMVKKSASNLSDEISKVMYNAAREIMLESKMAYVPVYTGRLRASGIVSIPQIRGNETTVVAQYLAPYAEYQHEFHKTKSNFLFKPLDEVLNSGVLEDRIARAMLKVWGF